MSTSCYFDSLGACGNNGARYFAGKSIIYKCVSASTINECNAFSAPSDTITEKVAGDEMP
jgi:hypothetical protein